MKEFRIYVMAYDSEGRADACCWPYLADEKTKGRMVLVPSESAETRLLPFFAAETIGAARDMHRRLCSGQWLQAPWVRAEVSSVQVWEKETNGTWLQKTAAVEGTGSVRLGDWVTVPSEWIRQARELVEDPT